MDSGKEMQSWETVNIITWKKWCQLVWINIFNADYLQGHTSYYVFDMVRY